MNKIVASYNSLHCCQYDTGRKQNNKNKKQTEPPISCKQLTQHGERKEGNCKGFQGWGTMVGATGIQQEVRG